MARTRKRWKRKKRAERRTDKDASCDGKKKLTEERAQEIVRELAEAGGIYRAYECRYDCKLRDGSRAWHIGHIFPTKL